MSEQDALTQSYQRAADSAFAFWRCWQDQLFVVGYTWIGDYQKADKHLTRLREVSEENPFR